MSADVDAVVVGAGVVGLACARALARAGRDVVVLEAADAIGTETSSRNSEVIHAGVYYPPGSLKAQLCVEGKRALYAYCDAHGVPYRRIGKLIVACAEDERATLDTIAARAEANGVAGDEALTPLSAAEARALEPNVSCVAALNSPSTGIVDSHAFMLSLQGEAEDHGAMLALETPVEEADALNDGADGYRVRTGGAAPFAVKTRMLVNAAGLGAQGLARRIAGYDAALAPPLVLSKGCYFVLQGRSPFGRLIYPTPSNGGLGVHVTVDLGGACRFGPDAEWVDAIDYDVDPGRAAVMYDAVRRYWPALPDGAILPGYAGLRPKVGRGAHGADDFIVQTPEVHGLAGLVHLFGIESPGLTAALAIADRVEAALRDA